MDQIFSHITGHITDSHSEQVRAELGVTALLRPEIEWDGGEFVDDRFGQSGFGKVDGFYISLAGIAALDAYIRKSLGSVDGQFRVILLAATGAEKAAELPLGKAETAKQASSAAIAQRPQNSAHRPVAA